MHEVFLLWFIITWQKNSMANTYGLEPSTTTVWCHGDIVIVVGQYNMFMCYYHKTIALFFFKSWWMVYDNIDCYPKKLSSWANYPPTFREEKTANP